MTEYDEFAEALIDQLGIEHNEEDIITNHLAKAEDTLPSETQFESLESLSKNILNEMKNRVSDFTGIPVEDKIGLDFPELVEFKKLKGRKVFPAENSKDFAYNIFDKVANKDVNALAKLMEEDPVKYLVYSTYAKMFISKISTTYGDYLDGTIYLNKFVLSSYPKIVLYKQGEPYKENFESVNAGYKGALKMTLVEEMVHSVQRNLYEENKKAVIQVNELNEELAKTILELDDKTVQDLTRYLQMEEVPEDFPVARRANLFFMLNPDNFIVNVLGPDVMTFTKVEVDPRIQEMVPSLLDNYQRWLGPIQKHHAAFTTMEGMAEYAVRELLKDDKDFENYLRTFAGSDITTYQVRKSIGRDFVEMVVQKMGKDAYKKLIENPPTTIELRKKPENYLERL